MLTVKEERNILQTIKRKKANWTVHMLHRNCLLNNNGERGKESGNFTVRKKM